MKQHIWYSILLATVLFGGYVMMYRNAWKHDNEVKKRKEDDI